MRLFYYPESDSLYVPESDSLYVEFQDRPSVDTREIGPDIRLDMHKEGRPVGLDIDHASLSLDLNVLEARGLPHVSVNGAAAPTTRHAPVQREHEQPG